MARDGSYRRMKMAKYKARARRIMQQWYQGLSVDDEHKEIVAGKLYRTRCLCSCWMCTQHSRPEIDDGLD